MPKKPVAWLMLISSVAGENKTARMRIWRALRDSGAAALRDGVYLLPESAGARAVFDDQAGAIVAAGGAAHIVHFTTREGDQERDFIALFDRGADYSAVLDRLSALKSRRARPEESVARRALAALRRDIAALIAIDFFPGPARRQVEAALADAETALARRYAQDEPHAARGTIPHRDRARYQGRTWATRGHLWIDRAASAWLIQRFIDRKAQFLWLKKPGGCPRKAVGFDFDGAEFSHVGARVTFEVLAASFGLDDDRALARLGALVHQLDVGGVAVAEAAGVAAIMAGARAQRLADDKLLHNMLPVFDALYAAYAGATAPGA